VRIIHDPASIIRIKSPSARFNDDTFVTLYKDEMRSQYNDFFGNTTPAPPTSTPVAPSTPTPSPGESPPPTPLPTYEAVTLYLSFYGIGEGSLGEILDILADDSLKACFFVTADDILRSPDVIRSLCGSGHKIGLWLESGTYEEYLRSSDALFEAAKIKSPIVASSEEPRDAARDTAQSHGLIYRDASDVYEDEEVAISAVTDSFPKNNGARYEMRFSCSENSARILEEALSFAREWKYGFGKIVETTAQIS
jgi:hypothetical protein